MRRVIDRLMQSADVEGGGESAKGAWVTAANRLCSSSTAAELEQNISINHKVIELFKQQQEEEEAEQGVDPRELQLQLE